MNDESKKLIDDLLKELKKVHLETTPSTRRYSASFKRKIKKLYELGYSEKAIAELVPIAISSVRNYIGKPKKNPAPSVKAPSFKKIEVKSSRLKKSKNDGHLSIHFLLLSLQILLIAFERFLG